jgi:transcriptional regulator with XRE-family HTH domain
MKKLARNIRIIREIRNLTKGALGRTIGYSQKHISRIEKGEIPLEADCIKRIAKALKVSLKKLIDLDLKSFLEE